MRGADRAARHQRAQRGGDLDLPAVAAQRLDARIERRVGAPRRIGRKRAGDERGMEHALDREQAGKRLRGRELRAVEHREAFLGAEHDRGKPGPRQRLVRRHALAGEVDLADAEHRRRHVGERREVARCADRALARDHGNRLARQHGFQHEEGLGPHPGGAAAEAGELERHHQPHRGPPHRLADAGRVRQHDVALEGGEVGSRDAHMGEPAEAGVDPVDRLAFGKDGGDRLRTGLDLGQRSAVDAQRRAVGHRAPVGERRPSRHQRDRGGHVLRSILACPGRRRPGGSASLRHIRVS